MTNTTAKTIGQRVRTLREAAHMTQAELARRTFVTRSYIAHIETGRNVPSYEVMGYLADVFGVSRAYLDPAESASAPPAQQMATLMQQAVQQVQGIPVRYAGLVPADTGRWGLALERFDMRPVLPSWLGGRNPESFVVVTATGDCLLMSEGIKQGNDVLLHLCNGDEPRNGEVALVRCGDEVTLKHWYRNGSTVELRDGDGHSAGTYALRDVEAIGVYVAHWNPPASR